MANSNGRYGANIEEVAAFAVFAEHGNTALSAVYHSAEPNPCFQRGDLCRIWILLKDQGGIRK